MTPCPACSSALKSGKKRINDEGNVERRRYCRACDYADIVVSQPEVVLWTQVTRGPLADLSAIANANQPAKFDIVQV